MYVLSFFIEKGGEGKTTLAAHTSAALARAGKRVIAIDGDGQASLTRSLGLKPKPGCYDLLVRGADFSSVIEQVDRAIYAVPDETIDGELLLIPANAEMHNIANNLSNVYELYERLQELNDWADFVILDTPPSPSMFHAALYAASDGMIFPCQCEKLSMESLAQTLVHLRQSAGTRAGRNLPAVEILGIIPTQYRSNTALHQANLELMKAQYGELLRPGIPQSVIWGEASQMRQTLFAYNPASKAAKEAQGVADYALEASKVHR